MTQAVMAYRKQVLQVGIESTYGTDVTPTAAMLTGEIDLMPMEGNVSSRDVVRAYFGSSGFVQTEFYAKVSFTTELTGAATPGTACPAGPLFKACNMSEVLTPSPITGTAQAGGTTSTIKLAAGASAVDDFYKGMAVTITSGTGNGQRGRIIDYNGTSKVATIAVAWAAGPDATSQYSIQANTIYLPNSTFGNTASSSLSMYFNRDGRRHILLGARGSFSIDFSTPNFPTVKWDFTGLLGTISDVALPSADYSAFQSPVAITTANCRDLALLGYTNFPFRSLSIDSGNQVDYLNDVNNEMVNITDRKIGGTIKMQSQKVATFNPFTKVQANTFGNLSLTVGTVAGSIVGVVMDNIQIKSPKESKDKGIVYMDLGYEAVPTGTGNNELYLVFE